jgi:tetratricopeptide (TPR) repeat protein
MKRLWIGIGFFLWPGVVSAQAGLEKILAETLMPEVDVKDYPAFDFEWKLSGTMQTHVNSGLTHLDTEDYDKAIVAFSQAIDEMPSFAASFYYRATAHKILNNYQHATVDYLTAKRLDPQNPYILTELGELYQLLSRFDDAKECYKEALKLKEDLPEAYFGLANISVIVGEKGKAIKLYKKSSEVKPYPKALVQLGILTYSLHRKDSAEALAYFSFAIKADPKFQGAYLWRSMLYMRMGKFKQALADIDALVTMNPANPLLAIERATLYMELQDYDNAFRDLRKVIYNQEQIDRNKFQAKQSMLDKQLDFQFAFEYISRTIYGLSEDAIDPVKKGFCLMAIDEKEKAVEEFSKSIRMQPSGLAYFLKGLTFEHMAKHDSAFSNYDKALTYDKDIFDAHKKLGIYRAELNDWKGAYTHFNEMERIEPSLIVTYRLRSQIRLKYNDYYGIIIDLTKFISKDSTDADVYLMRGFSQYSVKNYKMAKDDYMKSIQLDSSIYSNYHYVVESLLQLKDTTTALHYIAKCDKRHGLEFPLFNTRLRIYIEKNNFDKANAELKFVLDGKRYQFTPEQFSTLHFLDGLVRYRLKDQKDAMRSLERSLKLNPDNDEALFLRSKIKIEQGQIEEAKDDLIRLSKKGHEESKAILIAIE